MAVGTNILSLILIVRKIKSNPHITFEELRKNLERDLIGRGFESNCSRNTIQRDIKSIREILGIDIRYDFQSKGYLIDESEYFGNEIESILEPFELLNALNIDGGVPDFVFPEKYRPKGLKHLFTLIDAVKRSLKIDFSYSKFSNGTESNRILEPYTIKEYRGRWYVVGREPDGLIKTFGLDRIENLNVTSSKFKRDPNFDMVEKFRYSFGIYSSEEYPVEDIILSFDAEDGGYLKSVPLHASQEIIKDTPEEFTIKLRLRVTADFIMEIMSRSWSLRVISPDSLRLRIRSILVKAISNNE
jgi:predicted DNA-binding transcriptional regulator YafY